MSDDKPACCDDKERVERALAEERANHATTLQASADALRVACEARDAERSRAVAAEAERDRLRIAVDNAVVRFERIAEIGRDQGDAGVLAVATLGAKQGSAALARPDTTEGRGG